MTWIAISDGRSCWHSPQLADPLLSAGSLLAELALPDDPDADTPILWLDRRDPWHSRLTLGLSGGAVTLLHKAGNSQFQARVRLPPMASHDALRLTYAFDGPARIASLTAENADTGALETSVFDHPLPIPAEDVAALAGGDPGTARITPAASLLGVSDAIEPVGPMPTIAVGTPVATAAGPRPIETLSPGDLIPTSDGRLCPVRRVVTRDVPALGRFRPLCLRAPYFGLDSDLTIAPRHRILVDGTDTEYLFGTETALIEARHLGPMISAMPRPAPRIVRYAQVVLDAHDCINTAGTWSESLYLGRLAHRGMRHGRSLLADVPAAALPVHRGIGGPLLKPFEAKVLVSSLCA